MVRKRTESERDYSSESVLMQVLKWFSSENTGSPSRTCVWPRCRSEKYEDNHQHGRLNSPAGYSLSVWRAQLQGAWPTRRTFCDSRFMEFGVEPFLSDSWPTPLRRRIELRFAYGQWQTESSYVQQRCAASALVRSSP